MAVGDFTFTILEMSNNFLSEKSKSIITTYQVFIHDKVEDKAVDWTKLVLCIDHVKHGQHPLYEKNLEIID